MFCVYLEKKKSLGPLSLLGSPLASSGCPGRSGGRWLCMPACHPAISVCLKEAAFLRHSARGPCQHRRFQVRAGREGPTRVEILQASLQWATKVTCLWPPG